jgi:hypothetical protein
MTYRPGTSTVLAEVRSNDIDRGDKWCPRVDTNKYPMRRFCCTWGNGSCPEGDLNPTSDLAADLVELCLSVYVTVKFVLRCGWWWLWRSSGVPGGNTDDLDQRDRVTPRQAMRTI